jgi:hypothetical protein
LPQADDWIEGRNQRYNEAPQKLEAAANDFAHRQPSLAFVLTLGDIIDGNITQARGQYVVHRLLHVLLAQEKQQLHFDTQKYVLQATEGGICLCRSLPLQIWSVLL